MARLGRMYPKDSVLHVVNRGTERRRLFAEARDYERFQRLIWRVRRRIPVRLLAYALMPNHWHLVVWPSTPAELSQFMHRLTFLHAAGVRVRSRTVGLGHVYQGRYHAVVIDTATRYLRVMRYVEANPVRAGLVSSAEQWRWSSISERARPEGRRIVDGPFPLPALNQWLDIVNRGMSPDELEDVRSNR
jgi:putative transposase